MSQLDVDLQSLPTELSEECSLQRAPQGGFLGTEKGSVSREKCGKIHENPLEIKCKPHFMGLNGHIFGGSTLQTRTN